MEKLTFVYALGKGKYRVHLSPTQPGVVVLPESRIRLIEVWQLDPFGGHWRGHRSDRDTPLVCALRAKIASDFRTAEQEALQPQGEAEAASGHREFDALPDYEPARWEGDTLVNAAVVLKWSGNAPPPAIGERVEVKINRLGEGIVTGYFADGGWLGLRVRLTDAPEWHRNQKNSDPTVYVFGAEI